MTTEKTDYENIVEGVAERFKTVPRLSVLGYEPNALHQSPAVYFFLGGFDRSQPGQVTAMTYRVIARLCVKWQENAGAEAQLARLINPCCAAIDADATLGGRIDRGLARVTSGEAGFVDIGDSRFRYCDLTVTVTSKGGYKSGI